MTKANRTRRANLRRSIACHRGGNPFASPHSGARFDAWREGMRRAVKVGKRSHHDLDRGHERIPATKERQYRIPTSLAPKPLPGQQRRFEHRAGEGSGLPRLHQMKGVKSRFYVQPGSAPVAAPKLALIDLLNALLRRTA